MKRILLFGVYTILSLERVEITVSESLQIQQQTHLSHQKTDDDDYNAACCSFHIEIISNSCSNDRIHSSCMAQIVGPKITTPSIDGDNDNDNDNDFLLTAVRKINSITFDPYEFTFRQTTTDHDRYNQSILDHSNGPSIMNYIRTDFEVILDVNANISTAIWHGVAASSSDGYIVGGHASFVIALSNNSSNDDNKNSVIIGDWHGSFTTETATYSLSKAAAVRRQDPVSHVQRYFITEKKWENLPNEKVFEPGNNDDRSSISKQSEYSVSYDKNIRELEQVEIGSFNQQDNRIVLYSSNNVTQSKINGRRRTSILKLINLAGELASSPTIDILLLLTNRAVCEIAGKGYGCDVNDPNNREAMEARIALMESQTNIIFGASRAIAKIRILRPLIYLSPSVDVYTNTSLPLQLIENNENATKWRDQYQADLVGIITASSIDNQNKNCGIARQYIAGVTGWASATDYTCLDSFSFQHQIGHNLGCYHNRADSTVQHPYGHGWHIPGGLGRTIMAEDCKPKSCPRYPFYSNSYKLRDLAVPVGNVLNDNSRRIRETAATVAKWRG